MGTIGNMLHKWENASQLGKCFTIGKMLHNWEYASCITGFYKFTNFSISFIYDTSLFLYSEQYHSN